MSTKGRSRKHGAAEGNEEKESTRISLYPLTPEQALRGFLSVDPAKLKKPTKRTRKKGDH